MSKRYFQVGDEEKSASFFTPKIRRLYEKLLAISSAISGRNFGSKQEAKGIQFGQSVAHYTSQAKLWALLGCESTIKTVGRGNSTHFAQRE